MTLSTSQPRSSMTRGRSSTVTTSTASTAPGSAICPRYRSRRRPRRRPRTADGRVLARRRVEAQLVAGGNERAVDVEHARTRTEAPGAGPMPDHLIEPGHIEHHAARERHRLAVISGAAAAHGERDALPGAGRGDAHHVGLVTRHYYDVGALVLQGLLQDRREPEEVAASHAQRSGVVQDWNVAQVLAQGSGNGHRADSRCKPRAWYSKSAACHPPSLRTQGCKPVFNRKPSTTHRHPDV